MLTEVNYPTICQRRYARRCPPAKPCLSRPIRAGRIVMFKFRMGEVIKVPSDVFASGRAKLVGVEEGEQNKHLRKISVGYVYSIREESPDQQPPLAGLARMRAHDNVKYVSEEQIAAWLKG